MIRWEVLGVAHRERRQSPRRRPLSGQGTCRRVGGIAVVEDADDLESRGGDRRHRPIERREVVTVEAIGTLDVDPGQIQPDRLHPRGAEPAVGCRALGDRLPRHEPGVERDGAVGSRPLRARRGRARATRERGQASGRESSCRRPTLGAPWLRVYRLSFSRVQRAPPPLHGCLPIGVVIAGRRPTFVRFVVGRAAGAHP